MIKKLTAEEKKQKLALLEGYFKTQCILANKKNYKCEITKDGLICEIDEFPVVVRVNDEGVYFDAFNINSKFAFPLDVEKYILDKAEELKIAKQKSS